MWIQRCDVTGRYLSNGEIREFSYHNLPIDTAAELSRNLAREGYVSPSLEDSGEVLSLTLSFYGKEIEG